MKIQNINNKYNQNFGAIVVKPKKGRASIVESLRINPDLKDFAGVESEPGLNKAGYDVVIYMTKFKSPEEMHLFSDLLVKQGKSKWYSNVNLIKNETAAKYVKAAKDK